MVTSIGKELHRARKAKNLSLRQLATIAEVSPSLLSQIENAKVNPSVATLYAIAAALALPPSYFFDHHVTDGTGRPAVPVAIGAGANGEHAVRDDGDSSPLPAATLGRESAPMAATSAPGPLVRPDTRARIELSGSVTWDRLTPSDEANLEFLEITYAVGATSGEKLSRHSGREYGLVLEGTLTVELGFQIYTLAQGDSIAFD
ncbi:MAG: helix-turn-helix domain-containing protein, partial [bacterium]